VEAPATERQIRYARDLGIQFSTGICFDEMRLLLSCHLDGEQPAPRWLIQWAMEYGCPPETKFPGKQGLTSQIVRHIFDDSEILAGWLARHVWRDEWKRRMEDNTPGSVPRMICDEVGRMLASDPKVMASIRRDDGRSMLSKRTIAYKAALALLQEQVG
jgi:hypothetical protein